MAEFMDKSVSASDTSKWTEEEIAAASATKKLLIDDKDFDNSLIIDRTLWLCVVNSKFRSDKAAEKYKAWTAVMISEFSLHLTEVFKGISSSVPEEVEEGWRELAPLFTAYAGCGTDKMGRSIMWIKTRPTQVEEEKLGIRAGVLYWLAVHADMTSMRNGITFVLDTEGNDMTQKIGNEGKLQRVYQSIPLRPQKIFILGAGWLKRTLINAIIAFASLFTKEKVIDRIEFAEMSSVEAVVDTPSLPVHREGGGGGIDSNEKLVEWVKNRLDNFPEVPSY